MAITTQTNRLLIDKNLVFACIHSFLYFEPAQWLSVFNIGEKSEKNKLFRRFNVNTFMTMTECKQTALC